MNINHASIQDSRQLERVLRDIVQSTRPQYIPGNVYVVFDSSDEAYVQYAKDWDTLYDDGTQLVQTSLSDAVTAASSNRNDVILINGHNTHTLSSMLTVSKNRLHFIGMGGYGRQYGQAAKVSLTATSGSSNVGTILNTGVRNTYQNIKFINNSTVAEGLYCFVDGGEYTVLDHCEVYKSTDMDVTGAAELVANGDSSQYLNSTFGSLATARSGSVIRPTVLVTKGTAATGKVARDVLFKDCRFWINASNTANRFVYGANAADVERVMEFDNCKFINNGASSNTPAQNVAFGSSLTVGSVLLHNCSSVNADTAMSTTTGVFVDSPVPTAGTSGISVQAS